jgi:site-specific recombinase XerD
MHTRILQHFLTFMQEHRRGNDLILTEQYIVRWMTAYSSQVALATAAKAFCVVNRCLSGLIHRGLTTQNLMTAFKVCHGNVSWLHLAQVLQSDRPQARLALLRRTRMPSGPLQEHIRAYLDLHHAVGKVYRANHYVLRDLDRFLASQAVTTISSVSKWSVECWLHQMTCGAAQRVRKARMAKQFFACLMTQGVIPQNPLGKGLEPYGRIAKDSFKPFIYTNEQVSAILTQATRLARNHRFPLRPHVCHTLIAMCYALALRVGEAQRLCIRDVDLEQNVLFIRETKFHKSRMVPFGPRFAACLQRYLNIRYTVFGPVQEQDPLFVALSRRPMTATGIGRAFHELLREVGLDVLSGRRRPRIHDLRHTFAVHRLLRWYREGADVQSRLMQLATFMGHVDIRSTEVYLTVTAELLNEASIRFRKRFGDLIDVEDQS